MNLFRRDSLIAPSEMQENTRLDESSQGVRLPKRNSGLGGKNSKYYTHKHNYSKKHNKDRTKKNNKKR
jgi:hypothetical protein